MSRLDDLPPDQRATLSLLLRARKSYREVAGLLEISERAVHDRAHAALAVLAPAQARALSAEQRDEVGDYLLGQRAGVGERLATRSYLEASPQAHAWANALADELRTLSDAPLPEIPPAADTTHAAPAADAGAWTGPDANGADDADRPQRQPRRPLAYVPSSRRAGAALLAALAAIIAVAVVLIVDSGGSSGGSGAGTSNARAGTSSTGTASAATSSAKAKEDRRITLASPDPASKAVGIAEVLSEGSQYAFYLAAEHLAPSKGFFYAVWLYNSPSSFEALSRAPNVGSNGNLQGGALLPKDASRFHTMLVTRETGASPTHPGPIVLRGPFALH
ncbi:MAG: hypothetical protein QOF54_290 [Solirubrobacteraceae bacterium]|jgi:hypothetical protein|nr:hypothetical protein [Solirubrobacteraceae bacterium]